MQSAYVNKPVEIELRAKKAYTDIFNEIEVDVVFEDEAGISWRVPAFWSGDDCFRVRFAAPAPGRYRWRSECTAADDAGLHGRRGSLEAASYEGPSAFYRHGRLRVADSRRTLEHSDGTPFLWLADTWWMGLTKRLDWPDGFRRLTEDRARKGFNVIQIVVGPLPDFTAPEATRHPQQANEAGWPWEADFARIDPAFYDLADLRLVWLVEQGLMPCIVGMWGYYLPFMGVEKCRQHWRNLVARYGAYPVVWCLAGECTMPTYGLEEKKRTEYQEMQRKGWTEVARYLRGIDPWPNLLTVHPGVYPGVTGRTDLLDETLVDFDMLQTGHGGYYSLQPTVDVLQGALDRQPRLPALVAEVNYEGIMGGSKDEIQRFHFWTAMMQGACGHCYGAQGIWAMSSREEPFVGSTGSWGEGFWQDVMHYPGATHVGLGANILRRYPWWRLEPSREEAAEEAGAAHSFTARIPGELIVAYFPPSCVAPELTGMHPSWREPYPLRIEPGAEYQALYINPCTGQERPIGRVVPEDGFWRPPHKPGMDDWLLVLEGSQDDQ